MYEPIRGTRLCKVSLSLARVAGAFWGKGGWERASSCSAGGRVGGGGGCRGVSRACVAVSLPCHRAVSSAFPCARLLAEAEAPRNGTTVTNQTTIKAPLRLHYRLITHFHVNNFDVWYQFDISTKDKNCYRQQYTNTTKLYSNPVITFFNRHGPGIKHRRSCPVLPPSHQWGGTGTWHMCHCPEKGVSPPGHQAMAAPKGELPNLVTLSMFILQLTWILCSLRALIRWLKVSRLLFPRTTRREPESRKRLRICAASENFSRKIPTPLTR